MILTTHNSNNCWGFYQSLGKQSGFYRVIHAGLISQYYQYGVVRYRSYKLQSLVKFVMKNFQCKNLDSTEALQRYTNYCLTPTKLYFIIL